MGRKHYHIIGVMSGTSLDGLDLAYCRFWDDSTKWHYAILKAQTFPYDLYWKQYLLHAMLANERELQDIDQRYGQMIGQHINEFTPHSVPIPDLIASHGHTVFHQPEKGITLQVGSAKEIASITGITTVADFRKTDVALGGQGAPLVPAGDEHLFGEYDYCLNLGGFCNVSYSRHGVRYAHDISPCNIIINHLSGLIGEKMDRNGQNGRTGKINQQLLASLNSLAFYSTKGPRSLGKEWFNEVFLPVINSFALSVPDLLRTIYEHIAIQISRSLGNSTADRVLVTGGGTHNIFLVGLIQEHTPCTLVVPDSVLIDFKEAIVFAFLGLLKYLGKINCYASVTGARQDSICGVIYQFNR